MVVNDWSGNETLSRTIGGWHDDWTYIYYFETRTSLTTIQTFTSSCLPHDLFYVISAFTGMTTTSSEIAVLESIFKLRDGVQSSIVRYQTNNSYYYHACLMFCFSSI